MLLAAAIVVTLLILSFTLLIRSKDLPEPIPVSPYHHLETRKAAIYENLRDLQFEYRVGKLSDADYQRTKLELQAELAGVLAEIDQVKQEELSAASGRSTKSKAPKNEAAKVCQHCGATFGKALKFCGECGKAMAGGAA
ncbi:MAG TPA: hypothetical protein VMZ52_15040 [Bryobacteraceae bacterium]|nr:hypothetical protein [Bryobacteraceae bacterium]